jgi:phosphate-selective porin OprO/OprP
LRESKPRVSIGAVYNFNHGALRTSGQRGGLLFGTRDITNIIADFLFKYKGFALSSEFALRQAEDPVTVSNTDESKKAYVFVGKGVVVQGSYLFPSNYEVVARYSGIFADEAIQALTATTSNGYTIGANRYFRGHRFKAQADVTWFDEFYESVNPHPNGYWQFRFQVEIGI